MIQSNIPSGNLPADNLPEGVPEMPIDIPEINNYMPNSCPKGLPFFGASKQVCYDCEHSSLIENYKDRKRELFCHIFLERLDLTELPAITACLSSLIEKRRLVNRKPYYNENCMLDSSCYYRLNKLPCNECRNSTTISTLKAITEDGSETYIPVYCNSFEYVEKFKNYLKKVHGIIITDEGAI